MEIDLFFVMVYLDEDFVFDSEGLDMVLKLLVWVNELLIWVNELLIEVFEF